MRAFHRSLVAAGVTAVLLGALAAPVRADSCPPQCPSGKLPLGIAMPMSGPPAIFGRPTAKAVEIAVGEINTTGGLLGVPVEAVIADTRCDAGMAASVARRHIEEHGVKFVIGPLCPAVATDTAPLYAKAGVIQIVPTVTVVELTRRNFDNVFRMAATDEQEAQAVSAYLAREHRGKKLTVVYGDFFYWRAMAEMTKLALPPFVKALTRFEPLQDVTGAYERLADKLRRDPPDVIYVALGAKQFVDFVEALRNHRVKSLLVGGQHMISQNFWRATRAAAEGIVAIAPLQSLNDPEIIKATEALRKADVVPDLLALYSYAAVQVFAEAMRRAGDGESQKVVEALRSGEFSTAVGRVAFDAKGDRRDLHYSVLTWEGGRLLEVQEIQQRMPAPPPDRGAAPAATQQPTRAPAQQPAPAASEGVLRFDQPLPFGPTPVYGSTIKQLAESVPLFPPVEVQDDALWKRNCSTCHKWDQQTLCQQGASYVADPGNVLRHQHPFGGPYKVALMRWSRSGCR